jgi:hypothetical protein
VAPSKNDEWNDCSRQDQAGVAEEGLRERVAAQQPDRDRVQQDEGQSDRQVSHT